MPTIIRVPTDQELSLEAVGVLSAMVNLPEGDYRTAEELCLLFRNDPLKSIHHALNELVEKGYVLCLGKTYAVSKLKLIGMKAE